MTEFQFLKHDQNGNSITTEQGKLRIDTARAYLSTSSNLHLHIYSREDLSKIMKGLTHDSSEVDNKIKKMLEKNGYFDRFVDAFVSCFFKEGYFLISALQSGQVTKKDGPFEIWLKSAIKILDGVDPIIENGKFGSDNQRRVASDFAFKSKLGLTFVNSVWNFYKDKKKSMQCDQFFEFFDRNIMSFCDTVNIVTALAEHIFVKYHDSIDRVKEEHVGQVARQACLRFLSYILNTQNVKKFKTNRENISKLVTRKLTNWAYNQQRLPPREQLENLAIVVEKGVQYNEKGETYDNHLRINLDDNTHTVNCLDIFVRPDVLVFDRGMVLSYWENNNKTDRNLFGYRLDSNDCEAKKLCFKNCEEKMSKLTNGNKNNESNSYKLITNSTCRSFDGFFT